MPDEADVAAPASLADVHAAHRRLEAARAELQTTVDRARAAGLTWAQLGDVLGTSRQAAFKRFGAPRDSRTGAPMTTGTSTSTVVALTERVFRLVDDGAYPDLAALMAPCVADVLTRDAVLGTWARAVAETGNLVEVRDVRAELADGSVLGADERALGTVVGHGLLVCEAGEWTGRVAVDAEGRVSGLLVVPVGARDLPF